MEDFFSMFKKWPGDGKSDEFKIDPLPDKGIQIPNWLAKLENVVISAHPKVQELLFAWILEASKGKKTV